MQHRETRKRISHHQGRGRRSAPGSPAVRRQSENAIATHSAAIVIGGSAALFRSGQGRCSRPEVAVIFGGEPEIERQRRHGDDRRRRSARWSPAASINCSKSPLGAASRGRTIWMICSRPRRKRAGDGVGVGAKRQQRRHRGQRRKACDPEQDTADRIPFECRPARRRCRRQRCWTGRPSSARCPSHQAGSATVNAKARQ